MSNKELAPLFAILGKTLAQIGNVLAGETEPRPPFTQDKRAEAPMAGKLRLSNGDATTSDTNATSKDLADAFAFMASGIQEKQKQVRQQHEDAVRKLLNLPADVEIIWLDETTPAKPEPDPAPAAEPAKPVFTGLDRASGDDFTAVHMLFNEMFRRPLAPGNNSLARIKGQAYNDALQDAIAIINPPPPPPHINPKPTAIYHDRMELIRKISRLKKPS